MAGQAEYAIDTLEGLCEFASEPDNRSWLAISKRGVVLTGTFPEKEERRIRGMYCPGCQGVRRMLVFPTFCPPLDVTQLYPGEWSLDYDLDLGPQLVPSLFSYKCGECESEFQAVVYQSPSGPDLAVLPSVGGGVSSEHCPDGVAYYLEQAQRAHSVGARSAAVAMYRGALEQFLFQQGYKDGPLARKIADLDAAIAAGTAPKWTQRVDSEFLDLIRELGNGSIHPNDGDVKSQERLDGELVNGLSALFQTLLVAAYEIDAQNNRLKTGWRKIADTFRRKKK